jgi:plastocyanin
MKNRKNILLIVLAVVILGLVLTIWLSLRTPSAQAPLTAIPGASSSTTAAASTASQKHAAGTAATKSPTVSAIALVAPVAGDQWIIGSQNTIKWSRAAGAPDGTITLLDATTGAVVGWIQQHLSPPQATFPWKTGNVFLSRTSPLMKDVPPGNYRIALAFTSPDIPAVTSQMFSIIPAAEAQIPTMPIAIQGMLFSPSSVTVTQGTKLLFVNQDNRNYPLTGSSGAVRLDVGSSTTATFDTATLSPGSYVFYSAVYPTLRLTITVKNQTS